MEAPPLYQKESGLRSGESERKGGRNVGNGEGNTESRKVVESRKNIKLNPK